MPHLDFDNLEIQEKLTKAYPNLLHEERMKILVELSGFVRAFVGMVDAETTRPHPNIVDSGIPDQITSISN